MHQTLSSALKVLHAMKATDRSQSIGYCPPKMHAMGKHMLSYTIEDVTLDDMERKVKLTPKEVKRERKNSVWRIHILPLVLSSLAGTPAHHFSGSEGVCTVRPRLRQ